MIDNIWIRQYTPFIHSRLSKMKVMMYYGDQTTLDDLTQQVLEKAIDRQENYDPTRGNTTTWLSLIINDVVSEMKRKTRDAMTHIQKSLDNPGDWVDFDGDPDSAVDGYELLAEEDKLHADQYSFYVDNRDLVDYYINKLPPRLSAVVRFRMTEGRSHKEIAGVMNISEENSRISYKRGLDELKALIRDG